MSLHIRNMTVGDIELCMKLASESNWNQTRADIERFLYLEPNGCFVGEVDGVPLGTGASFVFGEVGWIAMILVQQAARGQGLGTAIVKKTVEYLESQGVRTSRLDATPLGRPVYEKLGFVADFQLVRMECPRLKEEDAASPKVGHPAVAKLTAEDLEAAVQLDRIVSDTARDRLIVRICTEQPERTFAYHTEETIGGFVSMREGTNAAQIGPCLALNEDVGVALLEEIASSIAGQQAYVDIPVVNQAALDWATARGFVVQRELTRMSRGPKVNDHPEWIWASTGPEKG